MGTSVKCRAETELGPESF